METNIFTKLVNFSLWASFIGLPMATLAGNWYRIGRLGGITTQSSYQLVLAEHGEIAAVLYSAIGVHIIATLLAGFLIWLVLWMVLWVSYRLILRPLGVEYVG